VTCCCQPGQIGHEVVDRLQSTSESVGEEPGEPSLRFTREEGHPEILCGFEVGR